jgi:hypothetical protein
MDSGFAGLNDPTAAAIADAVWDEAWSGHGTQGTFGEAFSPIRANTAQAGASGSITLDTGANANDNWYDGQVVYLTGGTGAGQSRRIDTYTGSSKVATVSPNWATAPSSDTDFVIMPEGDIPGASAPTAGQVADAVWDELLSGHTTTGSAGEATGWIDDIKNKTDNLPSSPAAVGSAMTLADSAITDAKMTAAARNAIADHIWRRTYGNIRTSSNGDAVTFRSPLGMLSHFNNYPYVSSGVLNLTHEDDSTIFGTRQLTVDANADPIVGINTV